MTSRENMLSATYDPAALAILGTYLNDYSGNLSYEEAVAELGLPSRCADDSALAAAAVLLSHVQSRLPQWGIWTDEGYKSDRNNLIRPSQGIAFVPRLVCEINWAVSAPGYDWPMAYHLTYLPGYEVEVFTASADCKEFWGMCDIALGIINLPVKDHHKSVYKLLKKNWLEQCNQSQPQWERWEGSGLIQQDEGEALRDLIWPEEEEEEDWDELLEEETI